MITYLANAQMGSTALLTYYSQLWRTKTLTSDESYKPRSAAWKDLNMFIKHCQKLSLIIVCMDTKGCDNSD